MFHETALHAKFCTNPDNTLHKITDQLEISQPDGSYGLQIASVAFSSYVKSLRMNYMAQIPLAVLEEKEFF